MRLGSFEVYRGGEDNACADKRSKRSGGETWEGDVAYSIQTSLLFCLWQA